MVSPAAKRLALEQLLEKGISRRLGCKVVGLSRGASRYQKLDRRPELRQLIVSLAEANPRYGFRRVHALLTGINLKAVHRIWKEEGLSLRHRKRRRLARPTAPRVVPTGPNQVWSMDFATDRLENGRQVRILGIIDAFTRECLALRCAPSLRSSDLVRELSWLFLLRSRPQVLRSDNGPEFRAERLVSWLKSEGVESGFIEPGSPWQNGHIESFFGKLRDEVLGAELFATGADLQARLDEHLAHYNRHRPHSALGGQPPSAFAAAYTDSGWASPTLHPEAFQKKIKETQEEEESLTC